MNKYACTEYPNKEDLFQHAFLSPHFYSSMVQVDNSIKAPLYLLVTTWESPQFLSSQVNHSKVSIHWTALYTSHSILHIKQCTPSYFSVSLAVASEPDGAIHPFCFLYSLPYYVTLACLPVSWNFQMVSQYSAREIQKCLISKHVLYMLVTHVDIKCLHILFS